MFSSFSKQFEEPAGLPGKIAGKIMSIENRSINKWTLDLLTLQDQECLLEVGYGPGFSIESAFAQFPSLQLDGVDLSETMKQAAERRNKELIEDKKVRLFVGDIASFHIDKQYDKVFSVNNYPLWTDRKKGLLAIHILMKKGGKVAITVQPREKDADEGKTKQLARTIRQDLEEAGFSGAAIHYKDAFPVLTVCVTAVK